MRGPVESWNRFGLAVRFAFRIAALSQTGPSKGTGRRVSEARNRAILAQTGSGISAIPPSNGVCAGLLRFTQFKFQQGDRKRGKAVGELRSAEVCVERPHGHPLGFIARVHSLGIGVGIAVAQNKHFPTPHRSQQWIQMECNLAGLSRRVDRVDPERLAIRTQSRVQIRLLKIKAKANFGDQSSGGKNRPRVGKGPGNNRWA